MVVANFLVQENPLFTKVRSRCSCKPPTKEMLFSVPQLLSVYGWKSVIPLKVRALRMSYPAYFRLEATFLTQREGNRIQRLK